MREMHKFWNEDHKKKVFIAKYANFGVKIKKKEKKGGLHREIYEF